MRMRILAIDSATETCGVALWEEGRTAAGLRLDKGLTHTRVLMHAVVDLLSQNKLDFAGLDGLVAARGPGSFTGLRIGLGTVKGLAAATGKPLAGVSTLAVLAHQAPPGTEWVCPMIDARRGQIYWALYRRMPQGLIEAGPERVGAPAGLTLDAESCLFIGSGARLYADLLKERWPFAALPPDPCEHAPNPLVLARLGAMRLHQGLYEDARSFAPVYLRASDAEPPSMPD